MPEASDIEGLVRRAQGGDVVAFERLIDAHLSQIRRMARAFSHTDDGIDDLAQEALIRVYRSIGSYRFQSAFSTWLFAITRNCFLDHIRSRASRERAQESPLGTAHELREEGGHLPPDTALERHQERARMWRAIAAVPPEFRTVLVFFDIEGLTYDEIAAIEKVALGTVKSRLHRGRECLRRILTKAGETRAAPDVTRGPAAVGNLAPAGLVSTDKKGNPP